MIATDSGFGRAATMKEGLSAPSRRSDVPGTAERARAVVNVTK